MTQPKKPLFPVWKALIYLAIIIVNLFFWSSNVFAADAFPTDNYCKVTNGFAVGSTIAGSQTIVGPSLHSGSDGNVYYFISNHSNGNSYYLCNTSRFNVEPEPIVNARQYQVKSCNNSDPHQGTYSSISSTTNHTLISAFPSGAYAYNNINYKFKGDYEWDSPLGLIPITYFACDITTPVDKTVIITQCDYGTSSSDMAPLLYTSWSNGSYSYNGTNYKFNLEDNDYIYYSCDTSHQYDAICHENNFAAVPSFNINLIKNYPKVSGNKLGFQGCLYTASLTNDLDNKWDGNCYNATFTRTDEVADQNGNVDFSPYACEVKTCAPNQTLDSQGICQNIGDSEILPLSSSFKLFSCSSFDDRQCSNKGGFYSSISAAASAAASNFYYMYPESYNLDYIPTNPPFNTSFNLFMDDSIGEKDVTSQKGFFAINEYMRCDGTGNFTDVPLDSSSVCDKLCPLSGVIVDYNVDCLSTLTQCPDGTERPTNQQCSTKICTDGSEIPFDYSCPTTGGDGNNGTGYDDAKLLLALDKNTKLITDSLDDNSTLFIDSADGNTTLLVDAIDGNSTLLFNKTDEKSTSLLNKLDDKSTSLLDKLDGNSTSLLDKLEEINAKIGDDFLGDPITFENSTSTGLSSIFDNDAVLALDKENKDLSDSIDVLISQSKTDLMQNFNFKSTGAAFNTNTIDLGTHGIHDVSISRYSEHFPLIKNVIMLMATMVSLFIVLGSVFR